MYSHLLFEGSARKRFVAHSSTKSTTLVRLSGKRQDREVRHAAVSNPRTPQWVLKKVYREAVRKHDRVLMKSLLTNTALPENIVYDRLPEFIDSETLAAVSCRRDLSERLAKLVVESVFTVIGKNSTQVNGTVGTSGRTIGWQYARVLENVLDHENCSSQVITKICEAPWPHVVEQAAAHPNAPTSLLSTLVWHENEMVRIAAARNPRCGPDDAIIAVLQPRYQFVAPPPN